MIYVFVGLALAILYYLVFHGESVFYNQDINLAMDFVSLSFKPAFYISILITYALIIPLIYFIWKNKTEKKSDYWKYFILISLISLTTVFFTPFLRVWEQIKFLSLSSIIIIGCIKVFDNKMKVYAVIYAVILLLSSLVMCFQGFYPSTQKQDFTSMKFIEEFTEQGTILAEQSFSEHMRNSTELDKRILTSLYFENAGKNSFLKESLQYLTFQELENEKEFIEKSELKFIVFNFEDNATRNTEKIESKEFYDKIYSMKYYKNCLIQNKLIGFACGWNETRILKYNETKE